MEPFFLNPPKPVFFQANLPDVKHSFYTTLFFFFEANLQKVEEIDNLESLFTCNSTTSCEAFPDSLSQAGALLFIPSHACAPHARDTQRMMSLTRLIRKSSPCPANDFKIDIIGKGLLQTDNNHHCIFCIIVLGKNKMSMRKNSQFHCTNLAFHARARSPQTPTKNAP